MAEQHDPGEVAAAYAQQQLIAAIRNRVGRVSAAEVARRLGRGSADPTVLKVLTGRRAISMRLWFALALAYDIDPFAYSDPSDRTTLLPPAHRTWLGRWRPGEGLPRFHAPFGPDGEPSWANAAQQLSAWLDHEDDAGRLRLADNHIARYATVKALIEAGLPVNLATLATRLVYETAPPIEVAVHLIPDTGVTRERLLAIVDDLHHVGHTCAGRAMAVLLLAPRSMHRMEALTPGLAGAGRGDAIRLPPSATWGSARLTLTPVAVDFAVNGYVVLIAELYKDGTGPTPG